MKENNQTNNNTFEYTYSSKQHDEIEAIRKKYLPVQEDKMETLRKLDKSAESLGTMLSIILGVIGTLIMGSGMSMCMVLGGFYMIPGIVLGIIGMFLAAIAYPVYKKVTKHQRKKIAPQILALTEELSK